MGKVLRFPAELVNVEEWLKKVLEHANHNTPIILAIQASNGEVMTAYWKAEPVKKQELLSHIQIDIMTEVIEERIF